MKWIKRGKIFDPSDFVLADGCTEFAKSPQAIEFDDFVRIYFTSQRKTEDGKYVSCPQFVDMDKSFSKVINHSTDTVIELGGLGTFDEHGIFPINVLRHDDKILAYTCGWSRRVSVSIDMSIGFAISNNGGLSFEKYGTGPVLGASINEPFMVGDGYVKFLNGQFHMWYIFGTEWKTFAEGAPPDRIYKIGHAVSDDGITWQRDSKPIVEDRFTNESQALPSVIEIDGRYHMYFCYRQSYDFRANPKNGYKIGYAYSDDLLNWSRDDSQVGIEPTVGGWDSDMMCYPCVFECNERVYLLYNGNEFGRHGFGLAELEE